MKKIFISYSSTETKEATEICDFLEENGYKCFIANRNLVPGKEYAEQLLDNMDESGAVVLLLSEASNASPHVLREIEYSVSHNIPIIVYKFEEVELSKSMKYFLMTHQWISDSKDKKQELLKGIHKLLDAEESPESVAAIPPVSPTHRPTNNQRRRKRRSVVLGLLVLFFLVKIFKPEPVENNTTKANIQSFKVGDTVSFGTYYDEPIDWRVLKINDDKTVVLISKNILTMKSFDAPEGGVYNYYNNVDYWSYENHIVNDEDIVVKIRGNNDWTKSNLRTWLNSDKEVVNYPDQAPTQKAVGENFYYSEPGFLYYFTDEEKEALVPVLNKSPANTFSYDVTAGMVESSDLVYLLSSKELSWFDDAGISRFAAPSEACQSHDNYLQYYTGFVDIYNVKSYYWWLRDNPGEDINKVFVATTEYETDVRYTSQSAGSSDFGVRPAVTVDPKKFPVTIE